MFTKAECIPLYVTLSPLFNSAPPTPNLGRTKMLRGKNITLLPGSKFGETSEKSAMRERGKE